MQIRSLILLFLYARGKTRRDNEYVPSNTYFQKEIFLLTRRQPFSEMKDALNFKPLWYGPFSKELAVELNNLESDSLVETIQNISLTENGFKEASRLWSNLPDSQRIQIIELKEEFNRMPLNELLDYVYKMYKKFTKKSALLKENVDEYFDKFYKENELSDDYFVQAVNGVRYSEK